MDRKDLKIGIALLLYFPFLIAGLVLASKAFMLLEPKAESALEAILLFVLLMTFISCASVLAVVVWMLLMRPFLNEDEMRFLIFAGGRVPGLDRFLGKIVDALY